MNGHKPPGLSQFLGFPAGPAAPGNDELAFDLEAALASVIGVRTLIPSDAFTAPFLGTEREGHGIFIAEPDLFITIGYLVAEAADVMLKLADGVERSADVVAYDYESGLGLIRAMAPVGGQPLVRGSARDLEVGDPVIVAGQGGRHNTIAAKVSAKRAFVGYWEYMLNEAIFTTPAHPSWGGAALIAHDGTLRGVGSLYVEDAGEQGVRRQGNMFVPIDELEPIFDDLLKLGRSRRTPRPWLGLFTMEVMNHLVVAGVAPDGPADRAGFQTGDVIVSLNGRTVDNMADFYLYLWTVGPAGIKVHITILRDDDAVDLPVQTADRYAFMKPPGGH